MTQWQALALCVMVLNSAAVLPEAAHATPASAQAASGLDHDPVLLKRSQFSKPARRLALDLHLGRAGAENAVLKWLANNASAPASDRAGLWLLVCEERFRRDRYAPAAAACEQAEHLEPGGAEQLLPLLRSLGDLPPVRWSISGLRLPLVQDSDGNRRACVTSKNGPIEAIVDTGAEVSVVMESVARRLGARAAGNSSLETTTEPVAGQVAIIDRLSFGSADLLSVPVFVLSDETLTFDDGSSLPIILGLSALLSAGKAAFLEHGKVLALGDAVPEGRGAPTPLYWHPSGIGFEAGFARGSRAVHLDTGSRRTYLFPTAEPWLSQEERRTKKPYERTIAGIGGARVEQGWRFDSITLAVGDDDWHISLVEMAPKNEEGEAARIGSTMLNRFETIILDFEKMQMFAE
jgi:hypothetical protein